MKKPKNKKNAAALTDKEDKFYCSVCGQNITEEDYEAYDGMCWECWDDQLTEESEDLFGNLM